MQGTGRIVNPQTADWFPLSSVCIYTSIMQVCTFVCLHVGTRMYLCTYLWTHVCMHSIQMCEYTQINKHTHTKPHTCTSIQHLGDKGSSSFPGRLKKLSKLCGNVGSLSASAYTHTSIYVCVRVKARKRESTRTRAQERENGQDLLQGNLVSSISRIE